jgi:hypothetical protein
MNEAIAAIISVAVSSVVSVIVWIFTRRQVKGELYAKTISAERIAWIKEMREFFAKLLTISETKPFNTTDVDLLDFYQMKNSILIRLNPQTSGYENDNLLRSMLQGKNFAEVKQSMSEIRRLAEIILKDEWDKIKIEAGRDKLLVKSLKQSQREITELKNAEIQELSRSK